VDELIPIDPKKSYLEILTNVGKELKAAQTVLFSIQDDVVS